MSDDWIILVPAETGFIPAADDQAEAIRVFRGFAPRADEITVARHESTQFFDCGANFDSVGCPHCRAQLDQAWWGEIMTKDYLVPKAGFLNRAMGQLTRFGRKAPEASNGGFMMQKYELPCCKQKASLDALIYDWPQAFGRFALSGMNCDIAVLTEEQIAALSKALRCRIVVVYQHI